MASPETNTETTAPAQQNEVETPEVSKKERELEMKLVQLKLVTERSEKILATGKCETIKCHIETLQAVNSVSNECKREVEEQKIARKSSMDEISNWNDNVESIFEAADSQISRLSDWLVKEERNTKVAAQEEHFKAELKLHEQKLRMKNEISPPKPETQGCSSQNAKLPKLVITKFNGSFKDWPRFWGQFIEGINKSSVAPITKFTYLLELLVPKAKTCVESVPFSVEGYNRAKAILQDKYGKESEIMKSYVREIFDLPHIPNSSPHKIAEFSETLTYCVRALETLRKLNQVNGNVSMTLDKLSGIKRVQDEAKDAPEFVSTKIELNLQPNQDGVLECRGRIEGEYPVYLPTNSQFSRKLVENAHLTTHHGGVPATMAEVRKRCWIPKLRRLVKQVRSKCHGCVRFRARSYHRPPPGRLPATRTQGEASFQVLGVDFAGLIRYVMKGKAERKVYLMLYACSLTRAVHLELLKSLEVVQFLPSLKRLIARRGRPQVIYSDNATTFKAVSNWLRKAMGDESLNGFLTEREIHWRFNLSRAPWWGGHFERLIGLFKRCFHKSIGNSSLTFEELSDVILDIEVVLNNRPISYMEDDVDQPVLTPAKMLQINPVVLPELESQHVEDKNFRKRAKILRKCKDLMWRRWYHEYIQGLRERHRQEKGENASHPNSGDAVIIESEEKNRNLWKMGVVKGIYGRWESRTCDTTPLPHRTLLRSPTSRNAEPKYPSFSPPAKTGCSSSASYPCMTTCRRR